VPDSAVRYEARETEVLVPLKVVPGASRSRILGVLGDRIKVSVAAAPERGAANAEVLRLLARRLGVPGRALRLVAGHGDPRKTVAVTGRDVAAVRRALEGGSA
jgi:uncharacterized protein (TIGR00251 family)